MRKTKILTVLGVLLAMGITACGGNNKKSSSVEPQPSSSAEPAPSSSSEPAPSSSQHEHTWDQGTITTQPTCTDKGVKTFRCSGCNETKTEEVAALGHDWDQGTVTTPATCTAKGVKTIKCTRCNVTKTEDVAALGHDYSSWSVAKPASCSEEGLEKRVCSRCQNEETRKIDKLPHTFGEWSVTKPASCVAGQEERECSVCHEKETRAIPATGAHNWGEWTVVTPASCAKGQEKRVCSNCNIEEFRDIDPTGAHKWGEKVTIPDEFDNTDPENPVLIKAGYDKYECEVCHGVRIEMDASKATLDPILKKDGTTLMKNDAPVMSRFKTETAKDADDDSKTITIGIKLNKYWDGNSTPNDNQAYQGAFSFKFDFDKAADVVVYQRGCMDSFSGNRDRTYYSGADESKYTYGNFEFDVNGNAIDLYGQRHLKWSDVVTDRDENDTTDPLRKSGYSTFGDFLIGDAELVAGENTFTYKRLASYNLVLSHIILEVTFPDHAHEAAADAEWVNTNEDFHWKNCSHGDGHMMEKARHDLGEQYTEKEPTCMEDGLAHQQCKVCGYTTNIVLKKLAHKFDVKLADNAAGDDYIASETLTCSDNCGTNAIKWSALDYDATKSAAASDEGKGPKSADSGKAVDFYDDVANGEGTNHEKKGTHIIYNVNVPVAVENAGISMLVTKNQYSSEPLDRVSNDQRKGYELIGEEWKTTDSRYGLRVDGELYLIGKNGGAQTAHSAASWIEFPGIALNLTAGVHEIEFYKYGGYAVNHYAFMLTGIQGEAQTLGDWVNTDKDVHYKTCEALPEAKFMIADHEWIADAEKQDVEASGCATSGIHYEVCKVCGAKRETVTPPPEKHAWARGTVAQNSDSKDYYPLTCPNCDHIGAEMSVNNYSSCEGFDDSGADYLRPKTNKYIEYKIVVAEAGNYSIWFGMKNSKNGGTSMNDRGFKVKVGTSADSLTDAKVKDYGTLTADNLKLNNTTAVQVELVESVALAKGENIIRITCGGYRVYYSDLLQVFSV